MGFYLPAQLSPVNPRSHIQRPVDVSQLPCAGSVQLSYAEQSTKQMKNIIQIVSVLRKSSFID